jgi:hypothetical protein
MNLNRLKLSNILTKALDKEYGVIEDLLKYWYNTKYEVNITKIELMINKEDANELI